MNKIYKVVWSKVKNCYVVVSEIAKNVISGSVKSARIGAAPVVKGMALGALMALVITGNAWAETIELTNNTEWSSTPTFSSGDKANVIDGNGYKLTLTGRKDYSTQGSSGFYAKSGTLQLHDVSEIEFVGNYDNGIYLENIDHHLRWYSIGDIVQTSGNFSDGNLIKIKNSEFRIEANNIEANGGINSYYSVTQLQARENLTLNGEIVADYESGVDIHAKNINLTEGIRALRGSSVFVVGQDISVLGSIQALNQSYYGAGSIEIHSYNKANIVGNIYANSGNSFEAWLGGEEASIVGSLRASEENSKIDIIGNTKTNVSGDVCADNGGAISLYLSGEGSSLTGSANNDDESEILLQIYEGANWNVTGKSKISQLNSEDAVIKIGKDLIGTEGVVSIGTSYSYDTVIKGGLNLDLSSGAKNALEGALDYNKETLKKAVTVNYGYDDFVYEVFADNVSIYGDVELKNDKVVTTLDTDDLVVNNDVFVSNGVSIKGNASDIDALNVAVDEKADKATTLEGYGIIDAYTKDEVSELYTTRSEMQDISSDLNEIIGVVEKNYYKIADNSKKINELDESKVDKADTLAGYGITDAYTKTQVDDLISNVNVNSTIDVYSKDEVDEKLNSKVEAGITISNSSVAVGKTASANNYWTIAIGDDASADGLMSIAIGERATAQNDQSIAIGAFTDAISGSIAIGKFTSAKYGAVGIGMWSNAENSGVAIGYKSNAAGSFGSVAIGSESVANDSYTVSFGHKIGDKYNFNGDEGIFEDERYRRLINVADGIDDHDVVTVGQLNTAVSTKADASDVYTKTEVDTIVSGKANKADTLSGYGIKDAYTQEEVNAKIEEATRGLSSSANLTELQNKVQNISDETTTNKTVVSGDVEVSGNVAGKTFNGVSITKDTAGQVLIGEHNLSGVVEDFLNLQSDFTSAKANVNSLSSQVEAFSTIRDEKGKVTGATITGTVNASDFSAGNYTLRQVGSDLKTLDETAIKNGQYMIDDRFDSLSMMSQSAGMFYLTTENIDRTAYTSMGLEKGRFYISNHNIDGSAGAELYVSGTKVGVNGDFVVSDWNGNKFTVVSNGAVTGGTYNGVEIKNVNNNAVIGGINLSTLATKQDKEDLQRNVEANSFNIAVNADGINAISNRVNSNETAIDSLEATVEVHNSDISMLLTKVSDNFDSINVINDKVSVVENKLVGKADKADTLSGYGINDAYSKDEVNAKIADATSGLLTDANLTGKADKADTLAGYGITDAYTKEEADDVVEALESRVTDAYQSADVVLEGKVTNAYKAADNALESKVTAAYKSADEALKSGYESADLALSGRIDETQASIALKANIADVYTKTVADEKFAVKADTLSGYGITDAYTKAEVNAKIADATSGLLTDANLTGKADKADTLAGYGITDAYTKAEADGAIVELENRVTDAYKSANVALENKVTNAYKTADIALESKVTNAYKTADVALESKVTDAYKSADEALRSSYETADTALSGRIDATQASIALKANIVDVYTKTVADAKFAVKASTLSGYGITDAYTQAEVNARIADATSGLLTDANLADKADRSYVDTGIGNVTSAYKSADTALSNRITANEESINALIEDINSIEVGSGTVSNKALETKLTNAYKEADTALETKITKGYQAVGNALSVRIAANETNLTTVNTKISSIDKEVSNKADKSTTLKGYGITDTYTKAEIDNKLNSATKSTVSDGNIMELKNKTQNISEETTEGNTVVNGDVEVLGNITAQYAEFIQGASFANDSVRISSDGIVRFGGSGKTSNVTIYGTGSTSIEAKGAVVAGNVVSNGQVESSGDIVSTNGDVKAGDVSLKETAQALEGKADKADTLSGYGITDAYTKAEVDSKFDDKVDAKDVYTKADVDSKLADKVDKTYVDSNFAKVGDVYTKEEADATFVKRTELATIDENGNLVAISTKTELNRNFVVEDGVNGTEISINKGTDSQIIIGADGSMLFGTNSTQIDDNGVFAGRIDMGENDPHNYANAQAAINQDGYIKGASGKFEVNGETGNVTGGTYNGVKLEHNSDGEAVINDVNINQMSEQVGSNAESVSALTQRLGKISGKLNKVGAGAAALAALHPLEYDPDDKLTFSAGVGNYAGENAAALGAFYRPDEKLMFSIGGTMGNGENMVNLGVSIGLDGAKGIPKLSRKELVQIVAAMHAESKEIKTENEAIKAENVALEERVAKLEALVAKLAEK